MTSVSGLGGGAAQFLRAGHKPPSFDQLDANSDKSITLDELTAGAPGGAKSAAAQKRAESLFKAMDSNADGSVTSDEKDAFDLKLANQRQDMNFMAQLLAGGQKPPSNSDVFNATDTDGNGSVSLAELSDDEAAKGASSDSVEAIFKLIDVDSDGAISREESSTFLDAIKDAVGKLAGGQPPPPPEGGMPPPTGAAEAGSASLDLLNAAQTAYGSARKNMDLISVLNSLLNEAA